jgi:hypothetical protein
MLATALLLTLAATADPLAPARQGLVECYDPVPAQKLCSAIGSYAFAADGSISNLATTRLQESPAIVMFARSAVIVTDGKVCSAGPLKAFDIERIEIDGQPVTAANLAAARNEIISGLPEIMKTGKPICTTSAANPDGTFSETVDIGGVAQPDLTATFQWVNPAEGWNVVP